MTSVGDELGEMVRMLERLPADELDRLTNRAPVPFRDLLRYFRRHRHAYVATAPDLLKTLREHDPDLVILDGALAECDRVGDSRADYSAKHRWRGVNVQSLPIPPAVCCGSRPHCQATPTTCRPHPPHHPDL